MQPPKISIIVNNHNYVRFLRDAIDSAIFQTYDNCEVIVVDDGSTDNSKETILSYGPRIRAVFKKNGGQASALNAGFRVSNGEIIIFLDADDRLYAHANAVIVSLWKGNLAKIQYPLDYVSETGEMIGRTTPVYRVSAQQARQALLRGPLFFSSPTSGNAFSHTSLAKIFPIPEKHFRICADAYLASCCPFMGDILSLERPLGQMRLHGSNNITFANADALRHYNGIASARVIYRALSESFEQDVEPFENWIANSPSYWLSRLQSIHHETDDSLETGIWQIALKALRANLSYRSYPRRKRLLLALWILAIACAPRKVAEGLFDVSGKIARGINRSSGLRWLLGSVDRVQELP